VNIKYQLMAYLFFIPIYPYNQEHLDKLTKTNVYPYADLKHLNRGKYDFQDANLQYGNFDGSDLRNANLKNANLTYASLNGLYLTRANLSGANLRYAKICGTSLCKANLQDAHIENADLRGSSLLNVNLENIHCNKHTKVPFAYECTNNMLKFADTPCKDGTSLPVGYLCKNNHIRTQKMDGCPEDSDDHKLVQFQRIS